jgi:hypothetical protein
MGAQPLLIVLIASLLFGPFWFRFGVSRVRAWWRSGGSGRGGGGTGFAT